MILKKFSPQRKKSFDLTAKTEYLCVPIFNQLRMLGTRVRKLNHEDLLSQTERS